MKVEGKDWFQNFWWNNSLKVFFLNKSSQVPGFREIKFIPLSRNLSFSEILLLTDFFLRVVYLTFLQNDFILFPWRQKSPTSQTIPIHTELRVILEKYKFGMNYDLARIVNQAWDSNLKKVGERAGINLRLLFRDTAMGNLRGISLL